MLARALPLVAILTCPSWAENIYLDPGFEASGEPGVARTGEKAGCLRVAAESHWVALGGSIEVEPFATYRVTVWAKGRAARGTIIAPYCYEWNNFEWSFSAQTPLKPADDWTQSSATFISPYDRMIVHPVALLDCAEAEAWVDDVVVERIASAEETMQGLTAKATPNGYELELIARYLVSQGKPAEAAALIGRGPERTSADIACLVAQNTPDMEARKPYIVHMVRHGALSLNDGLKRFDEVTQGMTGEDRLHVCVQAALADPQSVVAVRGLRAIAERALPGPGSPMTLADSEAYLSQLALSLAALLEKIPADSPARPEVVAVSETVTQKQDELDARRARLGSCTIRIGGKALAPETHAIAIPDEPTLQEQHAAKDLRHHLELVTGRAFDVVLESEIGDRTPIIVGLCALLEGYAFPVVPVDLGLEGIYIGTRGPVLALVGNQRGVLYATYTFLEEYVGCRWFTADCSTWPTQGVIRIPQLNRTYIPPLEYRTTDYPNSRDPDWAVRNRNNGTLPPIDEARGGHITYQGFVHTFNALVPPEEHFGRHPEWFSEIDGKRIKDYTQLCLTNAELLVFVKGRVRQWIAQNPSATIISVSQNDWHNPCHCATCAKLAEEEGSEAGPLIHFVNAIADDVREDYPHIIIDTLAYQYTRKPPRHVKPRPNVAVRLCSIECCFIHPLATDPDAASFVADIVGWSKICNRLHIWDYVINYAHTIMPFPNLYVLKPNINFFIDHGVTGIYEEACYYTKGAELAELRTYIMAKTLWDPKYDTDKAIDEFCAAYYGDAAPMIREYINTVHRSAQSIPDMHVRIYSPPGIGYLTPEVLATADSLFDRAERAVRDDPVLLHRVEVARLPVMYSQIALGKGSTYQEQGDRLVTTSSAAIPRLARDFGRIARAEGLTMVREGGPLAGLDAWLESLPQAASGVEILRLSNDALELAILPDMGGRIWRMRLKPSGPDLLKVYGEEGAWDPLTGGYEEYSEEEYRSAGWAEAYSVADRADRSIRLECKLKNGFTLARTIELEADAPIVQITSTLTNATNAAKAAAFRIHPAFQVETTQQAVVRMKRADGQWTERSLANAEDPAAELNVWLRDADLPAGEWSLTDERAGVMLTQTFDPAQVSHALLNWSGKDGRVNLELYSKQAQLGAGESLTLQQTYRVKG
ncbi:MAG: DUF4838 domain-containing protein [Armatimonadetes bacterium]|nr:DUF4838 domain-containing protein [Armatimonadota bacterium]